MNSYIRISNIKNSNTGGGECVKRLCESAFRRPKTNGRKRPKFKNTQERSCQIWSDRKTYHHNDTLCVRKHGIGDKTVVSILGGGGGGHGGLRRGMNRRKRTKRRMRRRRRKRRRRKGRRW
eukprot:5928376-Pyramimonas_sp.AAC.1